ncbi:DUF4145 domain-containing protein [Pseudomonas simiae]|uniref:DUF4145 domain-containing protein n=1 Tax=Pseudomonas simiae TaxID=321846 RepID=UPI0033157BD0
MTRLLEKRFGELEVQLEAIEATKRMEQGALSGAPYPHINADLILNWTVKAKSLLSNACGEKSLHLATFIEAEKPRAYSNNFETLQRVKAVFLAAKEDYEGGYLNSVRNLVQAEVFTSELEQAEELLNSGYQTAAAVIAGVVLETALRDLCTTHGIEHGTLNRMNDELAKVGVYNANQKKQITESPRVS